MISHTTIVLSEACKVLDFSMPRGLSLMPASLSVVVAVLMLLVVGASPTYTVGPGSPNGVPADVDCAIRAHAYEYGKQLLPRFGSFVTLFDALQLAENCNKERPKETTVKAPIYFAVPGTTSIYVDAKREVIVLAAWNCQSRSKLSKLPSKWRASF